MHSRQDAFSEKGGLGIWAGMYSRAKDHRGQGPGRRRQNPEEKSLTPQGYLVKVGKGLVTGFPTPLPLGD
jgi:hypothetical protein